VNVSSEPARSPAGRSSLERLRELLVEEGGLMAGLVGSAGAPEGDGSPGGDPQIAGPGSRGVGGDRDGPLDSARPSTAAGDGPAQLAAAGLRAEGSRADYELLIEAIYEGYLLHYGRPRVARTSDRDLGLLAGDRLYALGLARLIALGDLAAVAELADTITLSALAQGAGAPELADAVWAAGARAIGWGSDEAHRRAKELVFAGSPKAIEAMRTIFNGSPPTLAAPR
jgi:hypothetical protein